MPLPSGASPVAHPKAPRVASVDAYRGLVMLLMMGEVLEFRHVSLALPASSFWSFLAWHQTHVLWTGCTLHDLIQPSFSFLVGVAMNFSLARRCGEREPLWRRNAHAWGRALILVLLGVFLRSTWTRQTNWTFEDTLSQIGLGYGFLYLLASRSARIQWAALATLLVGYWVAFALYPVPSPQFDWGTVGVSVNDPGRMAGFAAHWSKNANLAWAFDTWFLNLFPRESHFSFNGGGYATLSFLPTLGTMILGLCAGSVLLSDGSAAARLRWLALAGVLGLALGWGLGIAQICPVVKRIWTPSWVLFSGGWCCLFLAAFYLAVDVSRRRGWAFPLLVVGRNSIAAYCIAHLFVSFFRKSLLTHFGASAFAVAGEAFQSLLLGAGILILEWLVLWWMYRRQLFLRI